jgi:hypothetical protein
MQEILECFLKDEDVDMQRQVQFIIKQLNLGKYTVEFVEIGRF